jgi:inosose dehydratase
MERNTRREFFKLVGKGTAAFSMAVALDPNLSRAASEQKMAKNLTLGMASYTFRKFSVEDTIKMTKRLGLQKIAFKSYHMALDSSQEKIKEVAAQVKAAGLDLYGCGVVYMKDEAEVNQAFEYAKTAGMRVIIGVPDYNQLELVNQKVKEYNIKLAIHNHGPGDERYPSPESPYEKVKHLDPRMGLCIDLGHTQRFGLDPADQILKYKDRLFDVHIKDVSAASKEGSTVEIGRGVMDIPKILKTLLKINYQGVTSFEFEKDADDPLPGVAESVGYVRGVLSVL